MTAAATRNAPTCCRMIDAIGFDTVWRETPNLRHQPNSRNRVALAALALALTASLVLASSAFGVSAGDEYLPQIPTSGTSAASSEYIPDYPRLKSGSSRASSRTGSHTPPAAGSGEQTREAQQPAKKRKASKPREAATLVSDQGGGGGDGSGSILLSPLVLLMIGAVIAAALGMTLSRRRGEESETEGEQPQQGPGRETTGPRTPEGEIVASPDQVT
jgi:hypothetical protein